MRINPRQMEKMAKKMGMKMDEIEAEQVIIKTPDKDLVINNPSVSKVNMMGQETFQISGEVIEKSRKPYTEDDVKMVMDQTGCTREFAEAALDDTDGNLAEAILKLKEE
jgi:nascent polypeptide-associated complex subunit alpha